MRDALMVGAGGFIGSIARYYLSGAVLHASGAARFPWGTLAVNTLGCLVIGILGGLAEHFHLFSPATRLLLFTGVLGGFTTYSAFAFETHFLVREHLWQAAAANLGLHMVLGLGAVWLGHRAVVLLAG
ncbi:MAG TPA: fluoride efflux transporter CrcB [Gemmatimonadales bacterium]|nr:fluoride efflux transporter CrcB [Gemmatimonadales bacterium]